MEIIPLEVQLRRNTVTFFVSLKLDHPAYLCKMDPLTVLKRPSLLKEFIFFCMGLIKILVLKFRLLLLGDEFQLDL